MEMWWWWTEQTEKSREKKTEEERNSQDREVKAREGPAVVYISCLLT